MGEHDDVHVLNTLITYHHLTSIYEIPVTRIFSHPKRYIIGVVKDVYLDLIEIIEYFLTLLVSQIVCLLQHLSRQSVLGNCECGFPN